MCSFGFIYLFIFKFSIIRGTLSIKINDNQRSLASQITLKINDNQRSLASQITLKKSHFATSA